MAKGIRKPHIIQDAPANWRVLRIVDGFGLHTYRIKYMDIYSEYKVFMLKEEGNNPHVCQIYDQDTTNQDKSSFRDNTSALC